MKKVYTCFTTSVIHEGHRNIIREAGKYGEVIVGALSDEALIRFNKFPIIPIEERVRLYRNIDGVSKVIIQNEMNYDDVIPLVQPDIVIHGDNWNRGPMQALRSHLLELLDTYGGELIDVPYTSSREVKKVDNLLNEKLIMPEYRRRRFRQLLQMSPIVKVLEAHSGISALIAEKTVVEHEGSLDQFDAMWVSGVCDSISRGKPDLELVDMSARKVAIDEIMEVTTKPILLDGGTGGPPEHLKYHVQSLERMGVSGIVIEDSSPISSRARHPNGLEPVERFCEKIAVAKEAVRTDDFLIIARVDGMIRGESPEQTAERAKAYINAGADGLVVYGHHEGKAEMILQFCDLIREEDLTTPLIVLSSDVRNIPESELISHKVNVVIYPNQLFRSAFSAMQEAAEKLLKEGLASSLDDTLKPIDEIAALVEDL